MKIVFRWLVAIVLSLIVGFGLLYWKMPNKAKAIVSVFTEASQDTIIKRDTVKIKEKEDLIEIPLEVQDNMTYIKVCVNGIPIRFILDTGCTSMLVSCIEGSFLKRQGLLSDKDYISESTSVYANGDSAIHQAYRVNGSIGNLKIDSIRCLISDTIVENLVGQQVLSKLGRISIDYDEHKLLIHKKNKPK